MLDMKRDTITRVAEKIMNLPESKRMFVLGIIQGQILDREEQNIKEESSAWSR